MIQSDQKVILGSFVIDLIWGDGRITEVDEGGFTVTFQASKKVQKYPWERFDRESWAVMNPDRTISDSAEIHTELKQS